MAPLTPAPLHPNKYGISNKSAMSTSPVFSASSMFSPTASSSLYSEPSSLCEVVPFQLEVGPTPPKTKTIRLHDEDFAKPLPPTPPSAPAMRYLRQAKLAQQKYHTLNHDYNDLKRHCAYLQETVQYLRQLKTTLEERDKAVTHERMFVNRELRRVDASWQNYVKSQDLSPDNFL